MTGSYKAAPRRSVLLAGTLVAVLAAHSSALGGPFVWDDRLLVVEDGAVHGDEGLRPLLGAFWRGSASQGESGAYYRPVTTVSLAFDWWRSGGNPSAFHLTNVVLHLAATMAVAALAMRLGAAATTASIAALLFGILPRLTESVSWISGRTDVLAGLFAVAAVAVHVRPAGSAASRIAAAALALAAVLAKEVGLAAFAAFGAFELQRARLDGRWRRAFEALVPAALALFVYAVLRLGALHGATPAVGIDLAPGVRVVTVLQTLGTLSLMAVDPLRPTLQIGLLGHVDALPVALGAVVAALAAYVALRPVRARWTPETCALLAFIAMPVALVLHVVPLPVRVVTADRFLYVPAAGLAVGAARWASRWRARRALVAAGAALALAASCAWVTFERGALWSDEVRLWRTAVRDAHPQNPVPQNELGNALFRRGLYAAALPHYERAAALGDETLRRTALANLSSTLSELGRVDEAWEIARKLVDAEPGLAVNRYNLALIEARRLDFDAAEHVLLDALVRFPRYADAQRAVAVVSQVRAAWSELPAESPSEPTDVRARRAQLWARLGVSARAAAAWEAVAGAPDATGPQLRDAAAYLAAQGSPAGAEAALRRVAVAGAASEDEIRQLAAVLATRVDTARVAAP